MKHCTQAHPTMHAHARHMDSERCLPTFPSLAGPDTDTTSRGLELKAELDRCSLPSALMRTQTPALSTSTSSTALPAGPGAVRSDGSHSMLTLWLVGALASLLLRQYSTHCSGYPSAHAARLLACICLAQTAQCAQLRNACCSLSHRSLCDAFNDELVGAVGATGSSGYQVMEGMIVFLCCINRRCDEGPGSR